MKTIKCKECGKELSVNASVCPECGTKLPLNLHKQLRVVFWIGAALLAYGLYIFYLANPWNVSSTALRAANVSIPLGLVLIVISWMGDLIKAIVNKITDK